MQLRQAIRSRVHHGWKRRTICRVAVVYALGGFYSSIKTELSVFNILQTPVETTAYLTSGILVWIGVFTVWDWINDRFQ